MDIEALRDKDFEVWVPFNDASVLMRYVGLDELREIRGQATTLHWATEGQRQGESQEPQESIDHAEAGRLLGRAAVRDWQGLTLKGEVFPFSTEHCDLLMTRWAEFAGFVGEVGLDLLKLMENSIEQSKKKSSTTSAPEVILEGSLAPHARR